MTTAYSGAEEPRQGLAIGGGVIAGILTLTVISTGVWLADRSNSTDELAASDGSGSSVGIGAIEPGDCVDLNGSTATSARFILRSCDEVHRGEVITTLAHPEAGQAFPGEEALATWALGLCDAEADQYLGIDLLQTTLATETVLPGAEAWEDGDTSATCLARNADGSNLTASVGGAGGDHLRGDQVAVSRLMAGDCFVPTDGADSYDLNSNSDVAIVSCDDEHNGVFFGRGFLDSPIGEAFPGEDQVGSDTSDQCGVLFESYYGESSDGFNYRYWRPNQQSWDLDDRSILCAILDDNPLTERFDPSQHAVFFDLEAGQCFNLGPEETSDSLRLDDQVRVIDCSEEHVGQMIGSGNLDQTLDEPFPAEDGVLQLAGAECADLFVDFIGVSPYDSELGNFPFWYPNAPGWDDGDRRYACAFLDDNVRTDSLEGAER